MLNLVLFEPEIPPNTGNVIRLCANTGAALHLVRPLGFRLDERSLRRAGLDYHALSCVQVHADFDACLRALGESRVMAVETAGGVPYSDVRYRLGDALVFGSERCGLPTALLERLGPERTLHIPMRPTSRSLNLSNAVAVVTYEAWRQLGFAGRNTAPLADRTCRDPISQSRPAPRGS